ncbi:MAG: PQQ-dependent sugar dehydrogenase [bacterium]|nr:PQQ-dependent sugar dehydrogenase [bacterium]
MRPAGPRAWRALRTAAALLTLVLLAACGTTTSSSPTPTPTHRPTSPTPSASPTPAPAAATPTALSPPGALTINPQQLVTGLDVPWETAFLPDGHILVTERNGDVRVVTNGQLTAQKALTEDVKSAQGVESGMLGLAVDPNYPSQPYAYVYYTTSGNVNRVSRFTVQAAAGGAVTLTDEHPILDGIPGGQCCHFGGRIRFGPDGDLYVTTGDGQQPTRAMDTSSPNGKILRLRPDGSVPPDNPIAGNPMWAYGFRNPQGLAWDQEGRLYVSDNGPTGELSLYHHDELDLVQKGAFYGWPLYAANTRTSVAQPGNLPAPVAPILESGGDVSWAPSGIAFYAPKRTEQPTLLVSELNGQQVMRVLIDPANPSHVTSQQQVLSGVGRVRDVTVGPDNCLYVLTSNADGRGPGGPDRMLKSCSS